MSAESLREQITEAIDSWWAESEFRTAHHDGVEHIASIPLADAVLAVLGEVTVTEEWAIHYTEDGDYDGGYLSQEHAESDIAAYAIEEPTRIIRRTVVTTRRVGEWEVAQ